MLHLNKKTKQDLGRTYIVFRFGTVYLDVLNDAASSEHPKIYFPRDSAPAHNSATVATFLNEKFLGEWIGI